MTTTDSTGPTEQLTADSCVTVSASVYARDFGAELVLLDFGRGEYFGLDELGAEIWHLLETGKPLGNVADFVVARYEVPRDQALRDIVALVSHMQSQGLVALAVRQTPG
jgi:hypothetical protein